MLIETVALGAIEVQEPDIYEFREGMPGFEQIRQFAVVQPDPELLFTYLQAVHEPGIAFLLCDPFQFYPGYDFQLAEEDLEEMNITSMDDIAVRSVVTIRDHLRHATINLRAPLIFNTRHKQGRQFILPNNDYHTQHVLIQASEESGGGAHAGANT